MFSSFWKNDQDDGGKNLFEEELLLNNLKRLGKETSKVSYTKITKLILVERLLIKYLICA